MGPPRLGCLGWTQGVEIGANQNVVPTFLFDFYTHYRPILRRLATIHNAADRRQTTDTDTALAIGRLCYSVGGLKSGPKICERPVSK